MNKKMLISVRIIENIKIVQFLKYTQKIPTLFNIYIRYIHPVSRVKYSSKCIQIYLGIENTIEYIVNSKIIYHFYKFELFRNNVTPNIHTG